MALKHLREGIKTLETSLADLQESATRAGNRELLASYDRIYDALRNLQVAREGLISELSPSEEAIHGPIEASSDHTATSPRRATLPQDYDYSQGA